jgi:hypothetical protein
VDKKGVHQIERVSDYLEKTGRRGFLAVELRMGVGHGRQAYLIPWQAVEKRHLSQNLKNRIEENRTYPEMKRTGSLYMASDIIEKEHTVKMLLP